MKRAVFLSVGLTLLLAARQPVQAAERIRVYLAPTTPPVSEFVDPAAPDYGPKVGDSVKDLRQSMGWKLKFVKSAAEADVLLEVMGRDVVLTGGTSTILVPFGFRGFVGASYPTGTTAVFIRMTVGTTVKDFVGVGGRGWSLAALDAGRQIRRWIDANRAPILARRTAKRV